MFSVEYKSGGSRGGSVICPISSHTMSQTLLLKGVKDVVITLSSMQVKYSQAEKKIYTFLNECTITAK